MCLKAIEDPDNIGNGGYESCSVTVVAHDSFNHGYG